MQKSLYIIREDMINEMFNTEDEKRDIATGGDDDRRNNSINNSTIINNNNNSSNLKIGG